MAACRCDVTGHRVRLASDWLPVPKSFIRLIGKIRHPKRRVTQDRRTLAFFRPLLSLLRNQIRRPSDNVESPAS